MAADAVLRDGLRLASDIVHVEPGNSGRLAALAAAADAPGVGGVLVVHAPSGGTDEPAIAALAAGRDGMKVPLLVCAMGETTGAASRRSLAEAGMAVFATPEQAVRGFLHLVQDRRNRAAARELPHSTVLAVAPDRHAVGDIFASMRRAGRLTTMQDEALAVLCAYGIPVVPSRAVASPDDAAAAALLLGYPAVVKLRQSVRPDARASGGLALDLHDAAEVTAAARRLAARDAAANLRCWCSARRSAGASCASGWRTMPRSGRSSASARAARRPTSWATVRPICRRSIWRWRTD